MESSPAARPSSSRTQAAVAGLSLSERFVEIRQRFMVFRLARDAG